MLPLVMAALGLLQDNQKKQAAAKQGQVDAANSSLIQGIDGMPPPAAAGAPAAGGGLGQVAGLLGALGDGKDKAKPAAAAPDALPPVQNLGAVSSPSPRVGAPLGGARAGSVGDIGGPIGGGPSRNALVPGSYNDEEDPRNMVG